MLLLAGPEREEQGRAIYRQVGIGSCTVLGYMPSWVLFVGVPSRSVYRSSLYTADVTLVYTDCVSLFALLRVSWTGVRVFSRVREKRRDGNNEAMTPFQGSREGLSASFD